MPVISVESTAGGLALLENEARESPAETGAADVGCRAAMLGGEVAAIGADVGEAFVGSCSAVFGIVAGGGKEGVGAPASAGFRPACVFFQMT